MNPIARAALAAGAFPLLAFAASASLASCGLAGGLSGSHRIRITLPEAPASWAFLPDLRMALSWRGPRGEVRSEPVMPGAALEIEVERGRPQGLLALPTSAGRPLRPAGALYPESLPGAGADAAGAVDEIALDWTGGYVASVALALEGARVDPRSFDLARITREAASRSPDPWVLDAAEAAARLVEGRLRAPDFDGSERFRVELPGEGPWAPESPLAAVPARAGAPGSRYAADLSAGLWRFVGAEEELFVSVDRDGSSCWVLR